jgi:hypothetical protein
MKEELMKFDGATDLGDFVQIVIDESRVLSIDLTDGFVSMKYYSVSTPLFFSATDEEVLNLVKALKR